MELNWKNAEAWEILANNNKDKNSQPTWGQDCGFKLDFDGPLLMVRSRFYPTGTVQEQSWKGDFTLYFLKTELLRKEFKCNTLDELKTEVEKFTKEYADNLLSKLLTA